MTIAIDTKKSFDRFIGAGFNKKQAEALLSFELQKDQSHLARQEDINSLDKKIDNSILQLIADFDKRLDGLKIWFLSALLTQTLAIAGIIMGLLSFGFGS